MPAGTVDVSVDGEWSFAQTLRRDGYQVREVEPQSELVSDAAAPVDQQSSPLVVGTADGPLSPAEADAILLEGEARAFGPRPIHEAVRGRDPAAARKTAMDHITYVEQAMIEVEREYSTMKPENRLPNANWMMIGR